MIILGKIRKVTLFILEYWQKIIFFISKRDLGRVEMLGDRFIAQINSTSTFVTNSTVGAIKQKTSE